MIHFPHTTGDGLQAANKQFTAIHLDNQNSDHKNEKEKLELKSELKQVAAR